MFLKHNYFSNENKLMIQPLIQGPAKTLIWIHNKLAFPLENEGADWE